MLYGSKMCCSTCATCTLKQTQEPRNWETGVPVLTSQAKYLYCTLLEVKFHDFRALKCEEEKLILKSFFFLNFNRTTCKFNQAKTTLSYSLFFAHILYFLSLIFLNSVKTKHSMNWLH